MTAIFEGTIDRDRRQAPHAALPEVQAGGPERPPWRPILRLACFLVATAASWLAPHHDAAAQGSTVYVAAIRSPITAVTADYTDRVLRQAEQAEAAAFVLELDTPGGEGGAMLRLAQRLLAAQVPTIVYVYPAGAHAASAGTFVVLAGHVAAMAPLSTIGAASPVGPQGEDLPGTLGRKVTEDFAATIRSYAQRRGPRAAQWAEKAVRQAASATADEALEMGVIDVVARDLDELLERVDGLEVEVGGQPHVLSTSGAQTRRVPMSDIEALLAILVHPTVALLLLTIGINAILIELSQPGGYVAGILGAISLLVAFYSLGVLDANLLGLAFMGLAFLLFAADIVAPTHGALTLGGVISFAVGAFILLNSPYYPFPWAALGGLTLGTGLIVAFAARATWRARRSRVTTGREGLVGLVGTARSDLDPTGRVMVYGELWRAVSDSGKIARGSRVRVLAVEGMQLRVEPAATTDSQT